MGPATFTTETVTTRLAGGGVPTATVGGAGAGSSLPLPTFTGRTGSFKMFLTTTSGATGSGAVLANIIFAVPFTNTPDCVWSSGSPATTGAVNTNQIYPVESTTGITWYVGGTALAAGVNLVLTHNCTGF